MLRCKKKTQCKQLYFYNTNTNNNNDNNIMLVLFPILGQESTENYKCDREIP